MIHSLFILNDTGEVLFEKHYRGTVNRNVCDYYWEEVSKAASPEEVSPVIVTPRFYLFNVLHTPKWGGFISFLATTTADVTPLLVTEFLHRVIDIFSDYFGVGFNQMALKDGFLKVYQVLEEMMDNGFPFMTEPNILKEMVKPPNIVDKVTGAVAGSSSVSDVLPGGTLSNMPWRRDGVHYANNEIYMDIIEELDAIIDVNGATISSEVYGCVDVNCKLSGMPDLTLTFENPALLDDVSLHQCVRYNYWEQHRQISFIPPDGAFQLMSYRVKGGVQPPITVRPIIRFTETGGKIDITIGVKPIIASAKAPPEGVVVTIPLPKCVLSAKLAVSFGSFTYDEKSKVCVWTIGRMQRDRIPNLSGTVTMQTGMRADGNPIISVQFTLPGYAASGAAVSSLSVHEKYKPYKGVRVFTKGGHYQIRS
ncbi:AP-3 complex subunit mu-2 [Pelomyxa schiedti]|nr:AP-3 complex subunit mu-2 [Pelomyxa schiedti]